MENLTAANKPNTLWITSLSSAWKESFLIFAAGRLYYTFIGVIIWMSNYRPAYAVDYYYDISPVLKGAAGASLGVWQRWDSIHYQRIATYGYVNDHVSLFYPLYPLVSRLLAFITGFDVLFVLLLVSSITFFLSMVMLHKIISQLFSEDIARLTLVSMVIFPSGFYFYAIFPQSLLLFLALLTYMFARRGSWGGAAATAYLAGLTHSTAIIFSILIGIEAIRFLRPRFVAFRERRLEFEWKILFALLAPVSNLLGTATFIAWRESAGFLPYIQLQSNEYARTLTTPWEGIMAIIQFIMAPPTTINPFVAWMNLLVFIIMVFLSVWSIRRIPWSWWLMQTGFLVFITTNFTTGYPLIGFFRYSLIIFPMFLEISLLGDKPHWRLTKFALALILSIAYSAMFFMWQYDL